MREARVRVLQHRTTEQIIYALAKTAANWLAPDSPWRQQATVQAPGPTGFSAEMVSAAIDLTFGLLTGEALGELVDCELGHRRALDEFCPHGHILSHARGPGLITHILAGTLPHSGIVSICCGLLLKSANLVKLATNDPIFPALFVESLREVDAELADCVTTLQWKRDDLELTKAAVASADAVIVYGDDLTVSKIRELTPRGAIFVGHGYKLSFGFVAKEVMTTANLPALAEAAAFDVSVYDQQGCLSPHLFYVEERGELGPRKFATALAEAMAAYQQRVPRGVHSAEEAAEIARVRAGYEFRSAQDKRVQVWSSPNANDWLVIYEDDPSFATSCLNRIVYVKPTDGFKRVLESIQRFAPRISTVGVAPLHERSAAFANELAKMGVHRVCAIGQMQRPP